MNAGESMDGAFQVIKVLSHRPTRWEHCLALARLKFDKYFKRKVWVQEGCAKTTPTEDLEVDGLLGGDGQTAYR